MERGELPARLDGARLGLRALLADDAAHDLLPVGGRRHVPEPPVHDVLVFQVGAGGLGLDAGRAALVRREEDHVVEVLRGSSSVSRGVLEGRVELVL